ncbi:MAG: PhzF family phenazine biosynthesis isomerase [Gammaproteobacteria bacterium]
MELAYFTADAFTSEVFHGAQIAVVTDAGSLTGLQMQSIAAEFNLNDTVFVTGIDPGRGFQARAFSPRQEVTILGPALIATAHVLAAAGRLELPEGITDLRVDCGQQSSDLAITLENGQPTLARYAQTVTPRVDRFVPPQSELSALLSLSVDDLSAPDGLRPLLVACPRPYLVLAAKNRDAARRARFDFASWSSSSAPAMLAQEILLVATDTEDSAAHFYARLLGPEIGVNDDPPVGAALPALAAWLCAHDHVRRGTYPFAVERGSRATRHSLLQVEMDNQGKETLQMRIGGGATLVCEGRINLPD